MAKAVEAIVADLANGWLRSYGLDYKLEQTPLNDEIDHALDEYYSKSGGNRPDCKLLLKDSNQNYYPILIEYKGVKGKLVKLNDFGRVANIKEDGTPDYRTIKSYAVNGAIHYANALIQYTDYTDIISIGMTGWKNAGTREIEYEIGVYFVSKSNFGMGQKVGDFTDLSFLRTENFDAFIDKIRESQLSPDDLEKLKEQREREISSSLKKLNDDIFKNGHGLSESHLVYLVVASIMATLGIKGEVSILEKADLKSSTEEGNRDGDILLRKVKAFLSKKNIPQDRKELIVRTIENTLLQEKLNLPDNGESQLKRIFSKIVDDLGVYYKSGLTTDFTGKLFNEMYRWFGFTQDRLNDVVLTPPYVATLLARLARVNKDSYVWDFTTGSAGLLVASMNEMLNDARNTIKSPDELALKIEHIKSKQILGIELLSDIYILAVLNMILMGDGSSNIINMNSLEFNGNYYNQSEPFPATAFILNPPYSTDGRGMIFVKKALSMMSPGGYAAIIIQSSAGSGQAENYNKEILKKNTLLAFIKMPVDLFSGQANVQTHIYVFHVGYAHQKEHPVRFIDFSNDGYIRKSRKRAKTPTINLQDQGDAIQRYREVVDLVKYGRGNLNIFTDKEYFEGHIDPDSGKDWNQTSVYNELPSIKDFQNSISRNLAWEISDLLNNQKLNYVIEQRITKNVLEKKTKLFRVQELFEVSTSRAIDEGKLSLTDTKIDDSIEFIGRTKENNGIKGYVKINNIFPNDGNVIAVTQIGTITATIRKEKWYGSQNIFILKPRNDKLLSLYCLCSINKSLERCFMGGYTQYPTLKSLRGMNISLPVDGDNDIDFDYMETFVSDVEIELMQMISRFLERKLGHL